MMLNFPVVRVLLVPILLLGPLFPVLPISPTITMSVAIGVVIFSIVLAWQVGRSGVEKAIVYISLFALAISIVPIAVKGYDSFLLTIILSGMLGFLALQYYKYPNLLMWIFLILCLYLALYFLRIGNLDEVFYVDMGDQTTGASRNFVGVVLLQYYLIYYAVCVSSRYEPSHWPLYIMPIIAIMSSGVSSTIVTIALLIGYLLIRLRVRLVHGILSLMSIVLVGIVASRWIETTLLFERLTAGDFVLSRILLWSDFFSQLNNQTILIGFSKEARFIDHPLIIDGIYNLHNSYLNLYKMVGIFSCLYFAFVTYVACAIFNVNKMLFTIFLGSLFRAATDGYYFNSFLVDFIIFYIFLMTPFGRRIFSWGGASNRQERERHV